jgi:hypothetical protein
MTDQGKFLARHKTRYVFNLPWLFIEIYVTNIKLTISYRKIVCKKVSCDVGLSLFLMKLMSLTDYLVQYTIKNYETITEALA